MSSEKNITGTTKLEELQQQFAAETEPYPQLKLLALICGEAHYSNSELAYTYAGQMLEIAETLQDKFWMAQALYCQVVYEEFCTYSNTQLVIDRLLRAAQLFEEVSNSRMQAKVWHALATEYHKQGDYTAARNICKKAIVVFEQLGDKNNYANCRHLLARTERDMGLLPESLEGLMNALAIRQETMSLYGQSLCHSDLGAVYMQLKDYQRAIAHYSQSLDIVRQLEQPMVEAIGLQNLANVYIEVGDIEMALQNYTYAQKFFHQLGYYNREGVVWTHIGKAYMTEKKYEEAQECYRQAETLFALVDEKDVQHDRIYLYRCLSKLYMEQQQWYEARDYLHRALGMAEETQVKTEEKLLHEQLSLVYEYLDDTRQALYHHRKYTAIKDEILDQEKQKAITEMQARFDVETAEREKELFRVKNVELSAALDEVHSLNERLTKLNAEKNEVLGVVAHDLKSPLAGVKMVSALLKEHYVRMSPKELYHQLDTIEQTSDRMLAIATSLLKARTLEDGGLYDTVESVDVAALVLSLIERYRNVAAQKTISLSFEQTGSKQEIVCNREGLEQVVENLVSNAVKFTPVGRNVYIRLKQSKRSMVIEVEDEGPGIRRKEKSRLFGKFTRLSAQPTGGESTTGLGLWIARQTIESMDGEIRCITKPGKGAMFRVLLRQPEVEAIEKAIGG